MNHGSPPPLTRWMALDVGSKTIGVALSDPLKLTAQPLLTLARRKLDADVRRLLQLAADHGVDRIIVGRPRHMDGRPAEILKAVAPLAERLSSQSPLHVEWYDERLSTREAEAAMARQGLPVRERRRRRNEFAAAVILQWYLEDSRSG